MDKMDRKALAGLTDKRKLSRLSPHRKLICKLRQSGATFSGIAQILSREKHLAVVPSTVYRFITRLEQEEAKPQKAQLSREKPQEQTTPPPAPATQAVPPPAGAQAPLPSAPATQASPSPMVRGTHSDDVWQKINALKQRPPSQAPAEKVFDFNEEQPLTLVPEKKVGCTKS
jgi:hypothetical protein